MGEHVCARRRPRRRGVPGGVRGAELEPGEAWTDAAPTPALLEFGAFLIHLICGLIPAPSSCMPRDSHIQMGALAEERIARSWIRSCEMASRSRGRGPRARSPGTTPGALLRCWWGKQEVEAVDGGSTVLKGRKEKEKKKKKEKSKERTREPEPPPDEAKTPAGGGGQAAPAAAPAAGTAAGGGGRWMHVPT